MTTSLELGGDDPTRVILPVVPEGKWPKPEFLPPAENPRMAGYQSIDAGNISGYGEIGTIERDTKRRSTKVVARNTGGTKYPWGTERYNEKIVHETNDDHPEKTSMTGEHRMTVELEDRTLTWEANLLFRSDLENFYYTYTRRLLQDGKLIREKHWEDTIPRDHQ
jgi:hypothetical protein